MVPHLQPSPLVSPVDKELLPLSQDAFSCQQLAGREGITPGCWCTSAFPCAHGCWCVQVHREVETARQSSANSTDKIVPQIPKAGLGLSNLAPKTAPAYISQARAASLIPRNHVLCICICHSDLHSTRLYHPVHQWGSGAWYSLLCRGCQGAARPGGPKGLDPACAMAQLHPTAERAGLPALPFGC